MNTQGSTPFEIAERRRQTAGFLLEAAAGTQKLIDQIEECDKQINYFIGLAAIGEADEAERALAREARKDRETYEAALEVIMKITNDLVGLEA